MIPTRLICVIYAKVEMGEVDLLPNGSEEMGVLGVGIIPVAIFFPSCQNMKLLHHNCIFIYS